MEFRGTAAYDGENAFQGSNTGPGFAPSIGPPEFRPLGRTGRDYIFGRDARKESEFDANQGYRTEVNEFGKRERP
jgi:hypothetical protein